MKYRATVTFWKLYTALPAEIKPNADKNFELLKSNPKHPSLHFKNIKKDVWLARVGMHYRAIALEKHFDFDWVWIGTHEKYDRLIK